MGRMSQPDPLDARDCPFWTLERLLREELWLWLLRKECGELPWERLSELLPLRVPKPGLL